jgi:hypothetical protein
MIRIPVTIERSSRFKTFESCLAPDGVSSQTCVCGGARQEGAIRSPSFVVVPHVYVPLPVLLFFLTPVILIINLQNHF